MDKRLSVARGMLRIQDLRAGSLFIYHGEVIIKTKKRTAAGACECITIGSGEVFSGGTSNADDLNQLRVQPAILSDMPDTEASR